MAEETISVAPTEPVQAEVKHEGKPTIAVKVYAPFKVYFEGEAYSVSAVNATGPFDILPRHHNFLCMLVPCTIRVQGVEGEVLVKAHRALMHVKADSVVVFMDV